MSDHTPTPWFLSGVRFRMNGGEWQSINRYDESKKQDENIACVGYDSRTGVGFADAAFIVTAVNNHDALVKMLKEAKAFMVIDQLSPAEHSFEVEKRNVFRKQLFDQIDAALAFPIG